MYNSWVQNGTSPKPTRWRKWSIVTAAMFLILVFGVWFGRFWSEGVPNLYRDANGRVDNGAVAATRTGLLAGLVGLGALGSIAVNGLSYRVTARTFRLAEQGQLHDRFAKANELLGDKTSPAVRLGGIYTLQQLAADTERASDRDAVAEVLSAFVRMNFEISLDEPNEERDEYDPVIVHRAKPSTDVLAAISVLAHLPEHSTIRADFTGLDFREADLSGTRLAGSSLNGVQLRRAGLAEANLSKSDLHCVDFGWANLENATFTESNLREAILRRAYLVGANFRKADLRGAQIGRVVMSGADFRGADLRDAFVYDGALDEGDLRGAKLDGADFNGLGLRGADIRGVDLTGVKGLEQYQIDGARGDKRTKLPLALRRPASWN